MHSNPTSETKKLKKITHCVYVCQVYDELYPISQVEDLLQNQPEWTLADFSEPLKGTPSDEP